MSTTHPVQQGQRYRKLILGVFAVGVVAFLGGMATDRYLAGLAVYAVACLGGAGATLYFQFASPVVLQDERDERLQERASHAVVNLGAYVGLPAFIAVFALDATGRYVMGPAVEGVLYAFSGFYLLWGLTYVAFRLRS